jgi:hypothetical protein
MFNCPFNRMKLQVRGGRSRFIEQLIDKAMACFLRSTVQLPHGGGCAAVPAMGRVHGCAKRQWYGL